MKKICSMTITTILVILICANLYIFAARIITGKAQPDIFGWSSAVVLSGSMENAISVNDYIIVHRVDEYKPGDIITFESGSSVVTHRIHEKTGKGFVTKGDANNTTDAEIVTKEQIVGKVVLTIPALGALIGTLQTPLGMTILVCLGLLAAALPQMLQRTHRGDYDETTKEQHH